MTSKRVKLTKEQMEKIRLLEEEIGLELVPNVPFAKPMQGEYYELYEDDRL